jgi:rod shape-determining protein MreD
VKRIVYFLLLSLFLIFLQVSVLPRLLPDNFKPDLLLILVLYLGLTATWLRGGLLCWYFGCLEDTFAGNDFGLFGITFLIIFLAVRAGASRFNTESSFLLLVLTFSATFFKGAVLISLLILFSEAGRQWPVILSCLLPEAVLNTLCALLLLRFSLLLRRRFARGAGIPGLSHLDRRYES